MELYFFEGFATIKNRGGVAVVILSIFSFVVIEFFWYFNNELMREFGREKDEKKKEYFYLFIGEVFGYLLIGLQPMLDKNKVIRGLFTNY